MDDDEDRGVVIAHSFPEMTVGPLVEITPCVSWTVGNEEAMWIDQVDLYNQGMYHHSNWYVVPEEVYPGEDGVWNCSDRGFSDIDAALNGTVLTAQSTQSLWESQRYAPEGEGVVVKIPPRSKIVANTHILNVSNREITTGLTANLHLIHPREVETVLVPFRFGYTDLAIPPAENGEPSESDFVGDCSIQQVFEDQEMEIGELELYYLLPHTHDLGQRFLVDIVGGPRDGERIMDLQGFGAQGNAQTYFPPVDLSTVEGLKFTCGYTNPRGEEIGYGIGDQEMCEILGMVDAELAMVFGVLTGKQEDAVNGVQQFGGTCGGVGFPIGPEQAPPTQEEIDGELYVPDVDPDDEGLPVMPECIDTDQDVAGEAPTTLTSVAETLFTGCAWSACHSGPSAAAGLAFDTGDLHTELLEHVSVSDPGRPLVDPGDRNNSVLYRRLAYCEGENTEGQTLGHMPVGSPTLLDDALVNKLGAWIDSGAAND